jgi:hypothetical protein
VHMTVKKTKENCDGLARVVTALGESTIPDILPSHGQHDSKRYTCIKSPTPEVKIPLRACSVHRDSFQRGIRSREGLS